MDLYLNSISPLSDMRGLPMNWVYVIVVFGLSLILAAILFQYWQRKKDDLSKIQIDLRPAGRITSFDGWVSLELQIVNNSRVKVWIEEAKLVINDLEANYQTALATGQQIHKISQAVVPDECLRMSLSSSLYEAAGRPQGPYSFLLLGTVHYRIDGDWAQANIQPHKIEMAALSVLRVRRVRQKRAGAEAYETHNLMCSSVPQVSHPEEKAKLKSAGK
jgi:hypothetical protein